MYDSSLYPQLSTEPGSDIEVMPRKLKSYPLHWHDFFEIEVITAGSGIHVLNGREYEICVGSAYLLKPTDYHELRCGGEITAVNVSFRESMLGEADLMSILHLGENRHVMLEGDRLDAMITAVRLLEIECRTNGEYRRQMLEYLVHFFVDRRSRRFNKQQLSGINKALLYMEFHFREPITLGIIAREAGFNPNYFSELFKATTGESFTERLNSLRLEYACTLLANDHSVSYACFESGFGSLSNFFTAFKKKYGVCPSEYGK